MIFVALSLLVCLLVSDHEKYWNYPRPFRMLPSFLSIYFKVTSFYFQWIPTRSSMRLLDTLYTLFSPHVLKLGSDAVVRTQNGYILVCHSCPHHPGLLLSLDILRAPPSPCTGSFLFSVWSLLVSKFLRKWSGEQYSPQFFEDCSSLCCAFLTWSLWLEMKPLTLISFPWTS